MHLKGHPLTQGKLFSKLKIGERKFFPLKFLMISVNPEGEKGMLRVLLPGDDKVEITQSHENNLQPWYQRARVVTQQAAAKR